MIECPAIEKRVIQNHYDVSTLFYRLLWGPHIHHGYWEGSESPAIAQVALTERLAGLADIRKGSVIYDIGCGMGGSSIWLAQKRDCEVTGVTLSPVQKHWATLASLGRSHRSKPNFRCGDAESIHCGVKSIESYRSRMMTKLNLASKSDLMEFGIRNGLIY